MVERSPIETALIEYRDPRKILWATVLIDRQDDGLSAVYSFFEPGADKRALGRFMILDLVRRSAAQGLPYVYLGYWVEGSRKMAYKTQYQPVEGLGPDGWSELTDPATD
jgi:arginine-tRNA-protein transferase